MLTEQLSIVRPWKERLFSFPWRPWKRTKVIEVDYLESSLSHSWEAAAQPNLEFAMSAAELDRYLKHHSFGGA
ncbi:hypothetical protein ACMG4P_04845 [Pseudovibrio denitrificans]|uniref:hypothetical protein n=1 Tax=Pseudovibrio denitrificans TaxID=258256 RepID=UPI0039BEE55C